MKQSFLENETSAKRRKLEGRSERSSKRKRSEHAS
jgi:hypothetical protein